MPRWLPRPAALLRRSEAMQFRWRRVLVKEYGTPFGWISVIIAVTLFNFWHDGEWDARHVEIAAITWAFAITVDALVHRLAAKAIPHYRSGLSP